MENKFEIIDMESWKRRVHCQAFRQAANPQYCVSFELDITNFYEKIHKKNWSFTFSFIYAVTKCASEIEEFRYRFKDGNVVLYQSIDTSFTYLNKETELFKVVNVEMQESMEDYIRLAEEKVRNQKEYFTGPMENDTYQFSSLPWVSFTHISHTDSGKKEQAVPMFDWGKFKKQEDEIILPFSVQVHHSFVDGVHIGKFADKLTQYLSEI